MGYLEVVTHAAATFNLFGFDFIEIPCTFYNFLLQLIKWLDTLLYNFITRKINECFNDSCDDLVIDVSLVSTSLLLDVVKYCVCNRRK